MVSLSGVIRYSFLLLAFIYGSAQAVSSDIAISENAASPEFISSEYNAKDDGLISDTDNHQYEHILLFDAQAGFAPEGVMTINEHIQLRSTGDRIERGIFRTLPLTWKRQDGKFFSVNYQINQVWRDGKPEPYSLIKDGDILTIRIGSANQLLSPGLHNYVIQYEIDNHFSRFPDWDELYWNVTGNGWAYDIDKARFSLQLPDSSEFLDNNGKDSRLQSIDVYTGTVGEKGHNAKILADGSVETLQPLRTGEGLTVAYTWPRSILSLAPAPQSTYPLLHLLLPSSETKILWMPVLVIALFYLFWWCRYVLAAKLKMPAVIPLYSVPEGITPGYIRYINHGKYDVFGFSSDILNLVAKRYLDITQTNKQSNKQKPLKQRSVNKQWLARRPKGNNSPLNIDEKQLLNNLFSSISGPIDLSHSYHKTLQKAYETLSKKYEGERKKLFLNIYGIRFYIGLLILLIPIICANAFSLLTALVTIPTALLLLLGGSLLFLFIKQLLDPSRFSKIKGWIAPFFALTIGSLSLYVGIRIFMAIPLTEMPAGYAGALISAILLALILRKISPRHTQLGLNDLALAKGLKMYLGTAERYRYQALYPPEQIVSHFEKMLPYALALGVGKTWANTFAQYLETTGAVSDAFVSGDWENVNRFSESCRSSSVRTRTGNGSSGSSSRSGSSSSGSGSSGRGSSGGGSGGGGGGGW